MYDILKGLMGGNYNQSDFDNIVEFIEFQKRMNDKDKDYMIKISCYIMRLGFTTPFQFKAGLTLLLLDAKQIEEIMI